MSTRTRVILVSLLLSAVGVSCAEGTNLVPSVSGDAGALTGATTPVCGDGKVEAGEMCECAAGSTSPCKVDDKTCADLGSGVGPLLCDPTMCAYLVTSCRSGTAGTGGGGTSG